MPRCVEQRVLQLGVAKRTKPLLHQAFSRLLLPALASGQARGYNARMRFRLRTLLIVLALGPLVLAGACYLLDHLRNATPASLTGPRGGVFQHAGGL
jgi:hypothetical protein